MVQKGKKTSYEIILPDFWKELKTPLDANADRAFIGPAGLILSVYPFDIRNTGTFWDPLRETARVTDTKSNPRQSALDRYNVSTSDQSFEIAAEPVNGLQLFIVAIKMFPDNAFALSLRVPQGMSEKVKGEAEWELGYVDGGLASADDGEKIALTENQVKTFTALDDPLLLALAEEAQRRAENAGSTGVLVLTKAQWLGKLSRNFSWSRGRTFKVRSSKPVEDAMGKPDHTQTVGGQGLWEYQCSDGVVQLAWNLRDEENTGLIEVEANDF